MNDTIVSGGPDGHPMENPDSDTHCDSACRGRSIATSERDDGYSRATSSNGFKPLSA